MADYRKFRGRSHVNLGSFYGGLNQVPGKGNYDPAMERNPNQMSQSSFGDTVDENTGEVIAKAPRAQIDYRASTVPQYPQYEKPGFLMNLLSGGRAGQDYQQAQFQTDMARAQAAQQLNNSLVSQQNQFGNQRDLTNLTHQLSLENALKEEEVKNANAKAMLDARLQGEHKNDIMGKTFGQNAAVLQQMGVMIPQRGTDDARVQSIQDLTLDPGYYGPQLRQSILGAQLAGDRSQYGIDELQQNRSGMLGLSAADLKDKQAQTEYEISKYSRMKELGNNLLDAELMRPRYQNEEMTARTRALGIKPLNNRSSLYDTDSGEIIYKGGGDVGSLLQNLDQKLSNMGTGNQPSATNPNFPQTRPQSNLPQYLQVPSGAKLQPKRVY